MVSRKCSSMEYSLIKYNVTSWITNIKYLLYYVDQSLSIVATVCLFSLDVTNVEMLTVILHSNLTCSLLNNCENLVTVEKINFIFM